jgi:hypothetical protein
MLQPTHPNLLEAPIFEAIHVLANHRVFIGTGDPEQFFGADIARRGSD